MAVPDQTFAPPALMLGKTSVLPNPDVTPAPAGGQAFALDPDGTIPASLQSSPITGRVASAGTIDAGTGFSVNRSSTGVYDITFDTEFAAAPTVIATLGNAGSFARSIQVTAVSTTGTTIKPGSTSSDAPANSAFNFVAYATAS